jgi:hypothetical protein
MAPTPGAGVLPFVEKADLGAPNRRLETTASIEGMEKREPRAVVIFQFRLRAIALMPKGNGCAIARKNSGSS